VADQNWFYSTLAQSTAALIGLAGGFMVNRILQKRDEIRPARDSAQGAFEHFAATAKEFRAYLDRMAEGNERLLRDGEALVDEESAAVPVDLARFVTFAHGPGWTNAPVDVQLNRDDVRALRELSQLAHEIRARLPEDRRFARLLRRGKEWKTPHELQWLSEPDDDLPDPGSVLAAMVAVPFQRSAARHRWRLLQSEYNGVLAAVRALRPRLETFTFSSLWLVLAALFACGLVAPLFYLTARPSSSSRAWLLWTFIPIAALFLLFMLAEILRVRRAIDLKRPYW